MLAAAMAALADESSSSTNSTTSQTVQSDATDSATPDEIVVQPKSGSDKNAAKSGSATQKSTKAEKLMKPGNIKDEMNRALKVFVPTEQIDVDKPVDFPTNI